MGRQSETLPPHDQPLSSQQTRFIQQAVNELAIDTLGPSLVVGGPSILATQTGPVSFNLHYGGGAQVGLLLSDVSTFALLDPNVTVLGAGEKALQKTFPISTATAEGTVSISGSGNDVRTVTVSDITGDGYLGIQRNRLIQRPSASASGADVDVYQAIRILRASSAIATSRMTPNMRSMVRGARCTAPRCEPSRAPVATATMRGTNSARLML